MVPITPGLYRHFKGTVYEVICVAMHTEGDYRLVIYRNPQKPEECWARPEAMFQESVLYQGRYMLRFTREK